MKSPASGAPGTPILPDYAPVPRASLGPAVNGQGYYVGRVERNLYWVTDGDYHSAFLTTRDGVVLFDAPPTIGHNLQRAVSEVAAAEGMSNTVTHLVYTHHHSDHAGGSSIFGTNVVRMGTRNAAAAAAGQRPGQAAARGDLRRPPHPGDRRRARRAGVARRQPLPGQHLHSLPGPRHLDARRHRPARLGALLRHQPRGGRARLHGRPGYRAVLPVEAPHRRPPGQAWHPRRCPSCTSSTSSTSKPAPGRHWATVDPTPYYQKYPDNPWAAVKSHLDAVADAAAAPVIEKYTGVLGAVDVFTNPTAFSILESIRLDLGYRVDVRP